MFVFTQTKFYAGAPTYMAQQCIVCDQSRPSANSQSYDAHCAGVFDARILSDFVALSKPVLLTSPEMWLMPDGHVFMMIIDTNRPLVWTRPW